ncbi:MAG TPA: PfkB family carbohydrate kinase, partial [Dehalococcoidia bacterium]|nr:PfkB family carbohydrate kinase [Dehalococcoidia bacterium]
MNEALLPIIDSFAHLRVLVIGDAMLDIYLRGSTERLCREAPVPIVALGDRSEVPGGAANVAANVRSLSAEVRLLATIGDDGEGIALAHALTAAGVSNDDLLRVPGRRTLTKTRIVSGGQMVLRVDQGDTGALPPEAQNELVGRLLEAVAWADAVILSDYGYGVACGPVLEALKDVRRRSDLVLSADGKDPTRYRALAPTAVKPNYAEAMALLDRSAEAGNRAERILRQQNRILEQTGAQVVAVTLDREGAVLLERGGTAYRTYAHPVADSRAAGAGDTFVAALTLALAAGAQPTSAGEIASAAANIVVTKDGTAVIDERELRESLLGGNKLLAGRGELARRAQLLRAQGKRLVFTNGCFDIIHRGHVSYLSAAKALGDVLVVGVNSDESVARLKGPGRPINCLEDRLQILAALSCVDYIVPFGEDSPVT